MAMRMFPTQFEVYDMDLKECVAKVDAVDESAVKVEILQVLGLDEWRQLSAMVESAIRQMELDGVKA